MLETVFSIGRPIPVCENINSTRIRGYGSARNLWNFDAFCLSSPKIERNSGVTLRKSAFLDGWLDQVADLPDPHPDIADMTDDELLSFVNAEVKQYRAEQRALESTQASH